MILKRGVSLRLLQPQTIVAMQVVEAIFYARCLPFRVTSVNDGEHMIGSLHYKGEAFDVGVKAKWGFLPATLRTEVLNEIREALGDEFDVVLEVDHIHVEYDPKPRVRSDIPT